jgi:ribokinase
VAAVGVVGDDAVGRDILATLQRERVDINWMETREGVATTVCACFVGDEGESAILWHIDDDVAVKPDTVLAAGRAFERADVALLTFEMPPSAICESISVAHDHDLRVFVQPAPQLANYADAKLMPWDKVDVLVPNEEEARALLAGDRDVPADELARSLSCELAVHRAVVTLGEAGCVTYADGVTSTHAVEQADAVDTTGAGDAFMATFTAHLTAGRPMDDAISAAQAAAVFAIGRPGSH